MSFGSTVRNYRRYHKLTRKELAKKAGLSGVGLWKIETGRASPKLETIYAIADALGESPELLIKR